MVLQETSIAHVVGNGGFDADSRDRFLTGSHRLSSRIINDGGDDSRHAANSSKNNKNNNDHDDDEEDSIQFMENFLAGSTKNKSKRDPSKSNYGQFLGRIFGRSRGHQQEQRPMDKMVDGTSAEDSTSTGNTTELSSRDKWISCIRILVIVALLVSTATVCVVVYCMSSRMAGAFHEENETKYLEAAEHVGYSVTTELKNKFKALDALAIAIQSYANSDRESGYWPNITIPQFPLHASSLLKSGRGIAVAVHPLVNKTSRSRWESYSIQKQDWLIDDLLYQHAFPDGYNYSQQQSIMPQDEHSHGSNQYQHARRQVQMYYAGAENERQRQKQRRDGTTKKVRRTVTSNLKTENLFESANRHDSSSEIGARSGNNIEEEDQTPYSTGPLAEYYSGTLPSSSEEIFQILNGRAIPVGHNPDAVHFPFWQHAPVTLESNYVNFDAFSYEKSKMPLEEVLSSQEAVIGTFFQLEDFRDHG